MKEKKHSKKHVSVQNVINTVLLGGRDMRAMVMPLRSCSYTVMLTSLRESFVGGEEKKMAKSRREKETTDKSQHQENITAIWFYFPFNKKSLRVFYNNALLCQTPPYKEKRVK